MTFKKKLFSFKKKMTEQSATKEADPMVELTSDNYMSYMELIDECKFPAKIAKNKELYISHLDHLVFCAKNYSKRNNGDEALNAHCKDIWTLMDDQKNFPIWLCNTVKIVLMPSSSEMVFMKTKLLSIYIDKISKQ